MGSRCSVIPQPEDDRIEDVKFEFTPINVLPTLPIGTPADIMGVVMVRISFDDDDFTIVGRCARVYF